MTLYLSNRDGDGKTNEEGHYRFQTKTWSGNVIVGSGDDLAVTQNSPLGMSVVIGTGDFKIDTGYGYSYTGWNSSPLTVPIGTADPANKRISSIVLYVDKNATTAPTPPNNPNIIKAKSVNGVPAAIPQPPVASVIQSSVGPGNPYIVIANVVVNAGVSSISNASILDAREFVSLSQGSMANSSIQERMISNNAITANKIKDGEVNDSKWRNGIAFYAKRVNARNIPATTFTKLSCESIAFNVGNCYSNTSDIGRFTAPTKGLYLFGASINANGSSSTIVSLYVNGAAAQSRLNWGTNGQISGSRSLFMNAGEYVEAYGYSSIANNIASGANNSGHITDFWGHLITRA